MLWTLASAMVLVSCGGDNSVALDGDSPSLAGIVRQPYPDVSGVVLPEAADDGKQFATKAESGHLLVVYFGYTACPDVCPTTMSFLRRAVRDLGDDASMIDVAMITVDPERDVPDRLTAYVENFFADGYALRTEDAAALQAAADAFGADYEITVDEGGLVEVAHTGFLYAVDPEGRIRVQWPFGTTAETMNEDLAQLIQGGV
ncbi:MAG: SCO family protein [Acidimicrobiia bacterium]